MASSAGVQRSISAACSTSRLSLAVPVRSLGTHSACDASAYNDCSLVGYTHRDALVSHHRHHLYHRQEAFAPSAVQLSFNSQAVLRFVFALHFAENTRAVEFNPHAVAVGEFHHSLKFLCCLFHHRFCDFSLLNHSWLVEVVLYKYHSHVVGSVAELLCNLAHHSVWCKFRTFLSHSLVHVAHLAMHLLHFLFLFCSHVNFFHFFHFLILQLFIYIFV